MVAVMVLVGIIAAVAIPRLNGTRSFDELGFVNETQAILRYAHKSAIASRRTVCVGFTATSISLTIASTAGGACDSNLAGPSGEAAPFSINARNSGAIYNPPPGNFSFNALGQPSGGQQSIVIQDGAANSVRTIVVEQETGHVRS